MDSAGEMQKATKIAHIKFPAASMSSLPLKRTPLLNAASGPCTEIADPVTNKRCRCKSYQEESDPPVGQPIVCRECRHGRSWHTGQQKHSDVDAILKALAGSSSTTLETARQETNSQFRQTTSTASSSSSKMPAGNKKSSGKETSKVRQITLSTTAENLLQHNYRNLKMRRKRSHLRMINSSKLAGS